MQVAFLLFLVLLLAGAFAFSRYEAARERRRLNQSQARRDLRAVVERRARQAL